MSPSAVKTPSPQKTPYEKWQDTLRAGKTDSRWAKYDGLVEATVNEFNARLTKVGTSYRTLDKRLIKAMVWVESGGPDNAAWSTRPMQMGNPGDPGMAALLGGKEGGDLILTAEQRRALAAGVGNPAANILAGTAYLLMRAASFAHKSVASTTDAKVYEVTVTAGDNLEKIAKANGTTVDMLQGSNPAAKAMIKPGQMLKFRKASVLQVITGWQTVNTAFAANKYNVGDTNYKAKLEFCLSLMPQ